MPSTRNISEVQSLKDNNNNIGERENSEPSISISSPPSLRALQLKEYINHDQQLLPLSSTLPCIIFTLHYRRPQACLVGPSISPWELQTPRARKDSPSDHFWSPGRATRSRLRFIGMVVWAVVVVVATAAAAAAAVLCCAVTTFVWYLLWVSVLGVNLFRRCCNNWVSLLHCVWAGKTRQSWA